MTKSSITEVLTQFRSATSFEDRYRALQVLTRQLPAEEAVAVVRNGLDDSDSTVRAGASRWLAAQAGQTPRLGPAEVWQSIVQLWQTLLADADPDVRFEAARGLIRLNSDCQPAQAALQSLLEDQESQPVMLAAILNLFCSIPAVDGIASSNLLKFLGHEQAAVRESAARFVGHCRIPSTELARELLLLLEDEEPFVREEAAKSLGNLQVATDEVIAALQTATRDEDSVVAESARHSLQQLSG